MFKSVNKILSALFAIFALFSLALPYMQTYIEGGESAMFIVRGANLAEFSTFGVIVVITPVIILAILFSRLSASCKTLLYIGVYILNSISLRLAISASREWLDGIATGYVRMYAYWIVYAVLIFIALAIGLVYETKARSIKDLVESETDKQ